jgi:uncharacterized membrane protein YsdA (DUF1294 family)/cold shock CspA family protein
MPQEKLPPSVQHGYVVMVNPKEGYGFIRPSDANRDEGRDVHFSVRQVEGHKNVRAGQAVDYYLTRTDKGVTAIKVHPGSVFSIPYLKFLVIGVVSALLLLAGLLVVFEQPGSLPVWIALWVVAFSIATYGVYAYDKAQAQSQGLRVPEAVLHLLEALGGSPGAFVAMRVLHHKNKKREFQVVFWLIVAAQIGFLVWLLFLR